MKKILSIIMVLVMLLAAAASAAEVGLTNFTTTDMEGNTVTQEIFSGYDLTMVNIWATWCGYCVEEMPELAKLKKMLPENVNLITICDDAAYETELTQQILRESGANFQTLKTTEDMYTQLLAYVYAFPTTFFVNSEGIPVVQPLTGVPSMENAADAYYTIIEQILKLMEE
ncbi:MAG: TlpA family protein disulfide reductase [Clostridia bacterium]|nr:TlpA family protein disulfide reductase [Clostridia bacterium]